MINMVEDWPVSDRVGVCQLYTHTGTLPGGRLRLFLQEEIGS